MSSISPVVPVVDISSSCLILVGVGHGPLETWNRWHDLQKHATPVMHLSHLQLPLPLDIATLYSGAP
jgi:hypothetical protein